MYLYITKFFCIESNKSLSQITIESYHTNLFLFIKHETMLLVKQNTVYVDYQNLITFDVQQNAWPAWCRAFILRGFKHRLAFIPKQLNLSFSYSKAYPIHWFIYLLAGLIIELQSLDSKDYPIVTILLIKRYQKLENHAIFFVWFYKIH